MKAKAQKGSMRTIVSRSPYSSSLYLLLSSPPSLFLSLFILFCGCQQPTPMEEQNSVYYWRTELRLDSTERAFLADHHIQKVFCRYFDVVMDIPLHADAHAEQQPLPNATIAFADTLPKGIRLVPTVFITEDCMHQPHDSLAALVVRRVVQMNRTNGISGVDELQIDCDYTDRSRRVFYDFLRDVRAELDRLQPHDITTLSATIRLHQLAMPPPPVDYGVLMLYNTGDPRRFMERNPILDIRDVQPYVRHLPNYSLPLAAAYPVYRWQRQVQGVRIEHTVEASEILSVKQLVEERRPELSRTILTYHLDQENINRYNKDTYEAIYHH